jgi:hypothetical protein
MNLEKLACKLAFIYDDNTTLIITIFFISILFLYKNINYRNIYRILIICLLTYILEIIIIISKKYFKTSRPCQDRNIISKCCPKSFDIPSGHTSLGVFHGLILYYAGYKYLSIFFFLQPLFRYIGLQHTITAIAIGGVYGGIFYKMYEYLNNKL